MAAAKSAGDQEKRVQDYLSAADIEKLVKGFDQKQMQGILVGTLTNIYKPSDEYIKAISHSFAKDLPEKPGDGPRTALSLQDRERCIIALLAARAEELTLGLHIYIALIAGVSPEEIANIIFLVGIYTGVDNLTQGLMTEVETLKLLKGQLATPPKKVAKKLGAGRSVRRGGSVHPLSPKAVFAALEKKYRP